MRACLFLITLFTAALTNAQKGNIDVAAPRDTIAVGEVFDVIWSMDILPAEVELPEFKDLEVVSGPSKSSSMSIVNGVTTASMKYTYQVKALSPGTYELPVLRVKKEGGDGWLAPEKREILVAGEAITISKGERFASSRPFPEGTTTIRFNEDVGYVAIQAEGRERIEFHLSANDVNTLRNILAGMRIRKD